MKRIHTLILLIGLLTFAAKAQTGPNPGNYDSLFANGTADFALVVSANLNFPAKSKRNKVMGLVIVEIVVSKKGLVSSQFMTRIDQEIEEEVGKLVAEVSPLFVNHNRDYTRFLAISYNQGKTYWRDLAPHVEEMSMELKHPFLGIAEVADPRGRVRNIEKYYAKLRKMLAEDLENKDDFSAYKNLTEMIRLNPFNTQDILLRQEIEQRLNLDTYRKYDIAWLRRLRRLKANVYK